MFRDPRIGDAAQYNDPSKCTWCVGAREHDCVCVSIHAPLILRACMSQQTEPYTPHPKPETRTPNQRAPNRLIPARASSANKGPILKHPLCVSVPVPGLHLAPRVVPIHGRITMYPTRQFLRRAAHTRCPGVVSQVRVKAARGAGKKRLSY